MKSIILTLIFAASTVIILTSGVNNVLSSGAPIGTTGAHGEMTCGKAGCHTGENGIDNINTGSGLFSISSEQNISNYIPGQTYDISVALDEAEIRRFGFALTALDKDNKKAGTLIVTDSLRTQIFEGGLQFTGREYITYKMMGTNPYHAGKGLWKFKWKAPDQQVGTITFFAAGVSANDDATDKGDKVYSYSLSSDFKSAQK